MIKEIIEEILQAIEDSFVTIAKDDYISYILYIGRADVIPELKAHFGTSCVIDYQLDRYYDATRELFYLHYLNRNYSKEGFKYDGEAGIDDLSIEMMIYCHLWDSSYFLKSLYRLSCILCNEGYQWNPNIPENGKYKFVKNKIITPLQKKNFRPVRLKIPSSNHAVADFLLCDPFSKFPVSHCCCNYGKCTTPFS